MVVKLNNEDWKTLEVLFEAGARGSEVASNLGLTPDKLSNAIQMKTGYTLPEYRAYFMAKGNGRLRVAQMRLALKGDRQMLIWLGKNRLGQSENPKSQEEFDGMLKSVLDAIGKMDASDRELSASRDEDEPSPYEDDGDFDEGPA